jgi:NAD(P)-dependent dehydrogenase (short-subunit alcohol dehydrogenase family)
MRLSGECVLVTGSTSGIGKQVAIRCAREGARVAVHGRDVERGTAVVRAIADAGGIAVFVPADLADEAACTTLVDTAARELGGLTVLVNNAAAGSGGRSPVGAVDTALWERVLRVNLTAVAWLCRSA